uniref:Sphingomyelin phosphodiesterase 4 n=1 Tax=Timema cristinae TaxID=61476 RepID=A0A7R9H6R6_TIMCR|nr:unnamed protein product [Timema cristinae]
MQGEWKAFLGKTTPSSPNRDTNFDLPILGSLAQHKSCALANYVIKAGSEPAFAWRESGKPFRNPPPPRLTDRDSNLDLPVLSSRTQHDKRNRIQSALNLPTYECCFQIEHLLQECTMKDLQTVYPILVENIFGITNQIGWGLRSTYRDSKTNYDTLLKFLDPEGPMFNVCYKLILNCYVKYVLPLSCLPVKIKKMIENGTVPPFYSDKVQIDPQTRMPTSLCLNPFEFYMFHFTYHLVNPWVQRPVDNWVLWDTVYLALVEIYLAHFLPCKGSVVTPHIPGLFIPYTAPPLQTTHRSVSYIMSSIRTPRERAIPTEWPLLGEYSANSCG